jgi:hypothetical protein
MDQEKTQLTPPPAAAADGSRPDRLGDGADLGAVAGPPFGSIERFPAIHSRFDLRGTLDIPVDF